MMHGVSTPAPFGAGMAWCYGYAVAPHAGAWIETHHAPQRAQGKQVAPHAGAWIETMPKSLLVNLTRSPLMQGRGLKQLLL